MYIYSSGKDAKNQGMESVKTPSENIDAAASALLLFQIKRGIINTFKESLVVLEELEEEHDAALKRLESELPEQYKGLVRTADYWHQGKLDALRRRILAVGNNAYRTIEEQTKSLNVEFK